MRVPQDQLTRDHRGSQGSSSALTHLPLLLPLHKLLSQRIKKSSFVTTSCVKTAWSRDTFSRLRIRVRLRVRIQGPHQTRVMIRFRFQGQDRTRVRLRVRIQGQDRTRVQIRVRIQGQDQTRVRIQGSDQLIHSYFHKYRLTDHLSQK